MWSVGLDRAAKHSPAAWPVRGAAAAAESPGASAPPPTDDGCTPVNQTRPTPQCQKTIDHISTFRILIMRKVWLPVRDRPSSSPPRPSCVLPPLCGVVPSPRCVSSPPAHVGAARAPAASSSRAHAVVAAGGHRRPVHSWQCPSSGFCLVICDTELLFSHPQEN